MRRSILFLMLAASLTGGSVYAENKTASADSKEAPVDTEILEYFNDETEERPFSISYPLFSSYFAKDANEASDFFKQRSMNVKPPAMVVDPSAPVQKYADVNTQSMLSFMMKNYITHDRIYDIPFVVSLDKGRVSRGYDLVYKDKENVNPACLGMGYFEASLKGLCEFSRRNSYGLVELNYNKKLGLSGSSFKFKNLPANGTLESYSHKVLRAFPRLLGFFSNHNRESFLSPLSTFDRHLYARDLNNYVKDNLKFSDISRKCHYDAIGSCHLYFTGENLLKLFGYSKGGSNIKQISEDNSLKVHFSNDGNVYLNLRNTILSDSSYINYGFYTEAEMEMIRDLGYDINVRDFIGNSIYKSGTPVLRNFYHLKNGLTAWNNDLKKYSTAKASFVPLSIGTHVYGSYNDIEQSGVIASRGYGSIGVRVDGSYNYINLKKDARISESGDDSIGVALTYGRNNILNIEGNVEATGENGIGLSFDFGSNVLSDRVEYQGSYRRVRSLDIQEHRLSPREGASVEAPHNILGPIASLVNISGRITGRRDAIYIDDSAHVRQINIYDKAKIMGNISSHWNTQISEDGTYLYSQNDDSFVFPGILQFDNAVQNRHLTPQALQKTLRTEINLGARPHINQMLIKPQKFKADPKAKVEIVGDITGESLLLASYGGHSRIQGYLDIESLYIKNSVVHIEAGKDKHSSSVINNFDMSRGGQLTLADGVKQNFLVRSKSIISNSSVICVDTDSNADLVDIISFSGDLITPDGVINFEPGLSYNDVKRFSSDPRAFYTFINKFVQNVNLSLAEKSVTTRFPKHIWYQQGDIGRYLNCASHSCYLGDFVYNYASASEPLPLWRYILSAVGCVLMLLLSGVLIRKTGGGRFG